MGKNWVEFIRRLLLVSFAVILVNIAQLAWGRDPDGRYKDSPLRDWFEHLASRKGPCCSFADGYVVQDADWESSEGHYRVRVPNAANLLHARKHDLGRVWGLRTRPLIPIITGLLNAS